MYRHKQLSSLVYDAWHFHARGQYFGEVTEAFCKKNSHHKLSVPHNQQTVSPWSRKSKTSTCLWTLDSFPRSSLLMIMLPFSLLEEDDSFCNTQPFSGYRFCVINHVSAPKLLSLIGVTCPVDTRKAHTVPYTELCHYLWDCLAPSVHTLLCNPSGPRQFCALPSECRSLWQRQQLNVSVHHASSVVDMLGAQVTTCQHLSCQC